MRTTISLAILTLTALPAPASASTDARWTAWLGCWQQLEETVRDDNLIEPGTSDASPTPGVVVCVTPTTDPNGVTLSTIVEKQTTLEETVIADGRERSIDEPGCKGHQSAHWTKNGRRLFARAELTCQDGTTRKISGLTTMAPGPVWVDIQVVQADGRESIRVRRYRRSPDQSHVSSKLTPAQISSASKATAQQARSFSLEEVKEASGLISASGLEAALIETNARFPLNARRLVELDSAGVPDRVLDLMIAMSFPDKFVVERRTSSSAASGGGDLFGSGLWWMDAGYDIFPYHYAPFGYGMWGRYDYAYYGAPVYVVGGASSGDPQPSGEGRVVDGMGYTRVRSRPSQPANDGGVLTADGGGGTSSSSGGSSSGGGSVTSQGYSGAGGGDSGRTAVPRPPQ